jgi:hypothetical protein
MEIDDISNADRITINADALGKVESEIVSLEQLYTGLESLKNEKVRLTAVVETLISEEKSTLAETTLSESVAVKRLIEVRAKKDVQSSRLANTQAKIEEQTASLSLQGERVRKAFQFVVGRLYTSREGRITKTLRELFGNDWIVLRDGKRTEMKFLARYTKLMKEIRDADNRLSHPISDAQQEEIALRQRPRLWLTELTDLVNREPGLVLRNVPTKQPSEQPSELVTA